MKKIITVICVAALVLVFLIPDTNAQGLSAKGIVAGLNMANVYGDDVEEMGIEPSNKMGFAAGVFVNINFNDNLAFRPELMYSQHGAKYENGGEITSSINAIDIPLLFQYSLSTGNLIPFILVGPYAAYVLSAEVEYDIMGYTGTEDVKDDVKSIDFGVVFGVGAVISGSFEVSARYQMGLQSVDDSGADADVKNKVIQIIGGIRL